MARNPFADPRPSGPISDVGMETRRKKPRRPTLSQKQATVYGGEMGLRPVQVIPPRPSGPISDVGMESRRQQRLRSSFAPTPPRKPVSFETRYQAAVAAPAKLSAQRLLAETMAARRRQEYLQTLVPSPHPILSVEDAARRAHVGAPTPLGRAIGRGAVGAVTGTAGALHGFADWVHAPHQTIAEYAISHPGELAHQARVVTRAATGVDLRKLVHPVATTQADLAERRKLERDFRAWRRKNPHADVEAFARTQKVSAPLVGWAAPLGGRLGAALAEVIPRPLVKEAVGNVLIRGPARDETHALVDALTKGRVQGTRKGVPAKEAAKEAKGFRVRQAAKIKASLDVQAHQAIQGLEPAQARVVAAQHWRDAIELLKQEPAAAKLTTGIRHYRNARILAELDPHYAPIPAGGIPPLTEEASSAFVRQGIVDAQRMRTVPKNPRRLTRVLHNAYRLAILGSEFRQWYEVSAKEILAHAGGDKKEADKLAQLFGIYSANKDVPGNSIAALRAYDQVKAGGKGAITEGSAKQAEAANKVMAGEAWGGRKTNTFYSNMAKHLLDDQEYTKLFGEPKSAGRVTVDIWMMRMFGFKAKNPTDAQYTWVENRIQELTHQLGWSPEEVQAAAWVALKAEAEKTSMETAGFDFAHGIGTHRGQVNFEAMTDELKRVLPPELHAQHLQDVLDTIEPGGRDLIREIVGIPGGRGHLGAGIETVEGRVQHNPGAARYLILLRSVGKTGDYTINEADRQLAEELAAATGHVLDQRAVPYGRVFQAKSRGHANAVELHLPGGLTTDLGRRLAEALGEDTAVVHAPQGAWLLNFTGKDNITWLGKVGDALDTFKAELGGRDPRAVTYDGALVESHDYAHLLKRLQQRRPGSGQALGRLAVLVKAVNDRYLQEAAARAAARGREAPLTEFRRSGFEEVGPGEEAFQALHPYREGGTEYSRSASYEPPVQEPAVTAHVAQPQPSPFVAPTLAPAPPPPTLEEGAAELMGGMGQATRLRREQQRLRSQELAIRGKEVARRLEQAPAGPEGLRHATAALSGPLPKIRWDRFTEMNPDTIEQMVYHIRNHPTLQGLDKTFTKMHTEQALYSIQMGQLPRKFEQQLLRNVFGDQATDDLLASIPWWKKNWNRMINVIGIPRTLLSSFDLSAPFRQGLVFGVTHPIMWGRNFAPMIKSFGSPRVYEQIQQEIAARPNFDLYQKARVPFTDLGAAPGHREEAFMSNYAEVMTGGKYSPVRASNRAYVAFLNKSRADYMDYLIEQARKLHPEIDLESPEGEKMLRDLGRVVGNATGRGRVPGDTLNKAMPLLNATLFAPRLLASRLDVLSTPINPTVYMMNSVARREAFKQLGALTTAVGGVAGIAALAGAKVNFRQPTNADWGKVRIGNTRFDIAGGFLQPVRLVAQVQQNKIINSVTGEKLQLGTGKFGEKSRLSIFMRFLETKESPPAGFLVDWSRGTDFARKPFSVQRQAYQRLMPLMIQDAVDFYRQGDTSAANVALTSAIYGIGMWGVGTQTYGAKPVSGVAGTSSNPFAGGGGGGGSSDPFAGTTSGSSSSSNPFAGP